jgi:hypothetical protein
MEQYIEILKVIFLTVMTFAAIIVTSSLLILLIKEIKKK